MVLRPNILKTKMEMAYLKYAKYQFITEICAEYHHYCSFKLLQKEYLDNYPYLAYYRTYLKNLGVTQEDDIFYLDIFARDYIAEMSEFINMDEETFEQLVTAFIEKILRLLTYEKYGLRKLIDQNSIMQNKKRMLWKSK